MEPATLSQRTPVTGRPCQFEHCARPGHGPYGLAFCREHTQHFRDVSSGKIPPIIALAPCRRGHVREGANLMAFRNTCRACHTGDTYHRRNPHLDREEVIADHYERYKPNYV